ncbi:MAG: hypothetical protein H6822_29850 [Planctomycetaceae bacterium]|nr:hypothetical protein [Planctomycetales bacterium]MCB9926388.1 hypothetical protein [Planctomycetaceae bacterium]
MTRTIRQLTICGICMLTLIVSANTAEAGQPKLGIWGDIVTIPREFRYGHINNGYRISSVARWSHAAAMRLERGDIIVLVNNMWFQNKAGFRAALCRTSDQANIGIINVRDGRFKWCPCDINHDPRPHQFDAIPDSLGFAEFNEIPAMPICTGYVETR